MQSNATLIPIMQNSGERSLARMSIYKHRSFYPHHHHHRLFLYFSSKLVACIYIFMYKTRQLRRGNKTKKNIMEGKKSEINRGGDASPGSLKVSCSQVQIEPVWLSFYIYVTEFHSVSLLLLSLSRARDDEYSARAFLLCIMYIYSFTTVYLCMYISLVCITNDRREK